MAHLDFLFANLEGHVCCPICGHDYVHPISIRVYPVQGQADCLISATGIATDTVAPG